jgi:uncharacterized protein with FMN-binding domain
MFPKRGAIALVTTALGLVLLFSFKTPDQATGVAVAKTDGSTEGTTTATTSAATTTVTGSTISTRYGDVAVEVTVANGTVTAVQAVALPSGGRSGEISAYAAPILASEALTAQSANIDIVSGATYTSQAYAQSLQAALDQAGLATTQVSG